MDSTFIIVFAAILMFAGILFAFVTANSKKTSLNVEKYRVKWLKIEQQLSKDNPASYQICIIEADKLLDLALKERRTKGATMGERMKAANAQFSNANAVWAAHKLRNRIAHESDVKLGLDEARRALAIYKRALKDMKAI